MSSNIEDLGFWLRRTAQHLLSLPRGIKATLISIVVLLFLVVELEPVLFGASEWEDRLLFDMKNNPRLFVETIPPEGGVPVRKVVTTSMLTTIVISSELLFAEGEVSVVRDVEIDYIIRWELLIAILGVWMISVIVILKTDLQPEPFFQEAKKPIQSSLSEHESLQRANIQRLLLFQIEDAARRCSSLYRRSFITLAGGIIMAFVGVATFFAVLPDPTDQRMALQEYDIARQAAYGLLREGSASVEDIQALLSAAKIPDRSIGDPSYWYPLVRAAGMLIFIEAIAWFLLKQYRALTEDYKTFYRICLKRANYLAALKVIEDMEGESPRLTWAAAVLAEDLSGKLLQGETTESLQGVEAAENNAVFQLVDKAVERMPWPKSK